LVSRFYTAAFSERKGKCRDRLRNDLQAFLKTRSERELVIDHRSAYPPAVSVGGKGQTISRGAAPQALDSRARAALAGDASVDRR
jgi:hypothetical protein